MIDLTVTVEAAPPWPITLNSDGLMVGHSLVDQSAHMTASFQTQEGGTGDLLFQIIPGAPLQWNWDNSTSADPDGRAVLALGNTNYLLTTESVPFRHVQGGGYDRATNTFASPLTVGSARTICDPRAWVDWHNLAAANGVTRYFVYETWHDTRSGLGGAEQAALEAEDSADPFTDVTWRNRLDVQAPHWADFVTMLRSGPAQGTHPALDHTVSITAGTEVFMVPGGQVFAAIYDAIQAGTQPVGVTYTDFFADFFLDTIHPDIPGRYAIACAMYAVIFRTSPVGLPAATTNTFGEPYPTLAAADAAWLQQIAWDVVQAHPLTGL